MTRTRVTLLVFVALFAFSSATATTTVVGTDVEDVTQVDDCTTITEPGRYALERGIVGGGNDDFTFISQSCVVVESDDVVLEGRGHKVDGTGVSDTTGIAIVGMSNDTIENVTIQNVTVADWNQGVSVRNADSVTVRNVTLAHNAFGMEVVQSTRVNLTRSLVRDNLVGVYDDRGGDEMILTGTVFEENYAGDVVSDAASSRGQSPDSAANRTRLVLG
ncbi:hypothetical protein GJR96_16260 [Haloferax sp. MBLA0076]|uniref:Right handed beta helix domain-containing protein n=1 Tax=Haloferax litoreum TaxID=2666140 RepID=A0A6A8GJE0_9EURY|nr:MULTISPECIES: right-handed parallel beta-helix repeat-containing protein [Haloferax]KAB1190522.1 right-handed parallel beta-helix repeat-containing protein [Haloferax sp. CBA1148]MRX23504.1 hypothetical protein [Haloferax litoreum]